MTEVGTKLTRRAVIGKNGIQIQQERHTATAAAITTWLKSQQGQQQYQGKSSIKMSTLSQTC